MTRELTPLEAFKKIKTLAWLNTEDSDKTEERINIIETALKEYELIKQTKFIVADKDISDEDIEKLKNQRMYVGSLERCEIKPLFDEETQNKLKALEIIKELPKEEKQELLNAIYSQTKNEEKYDLLKEELL